MLKRDALDTYLDRLASVAMIVAAVALVWVVVDRWSEPSGVSPVERFDAETFVDHPPTVGVQGDPDARIVVMEFSDFEWYCQVKRNRDDRPPTYLVRDGTRAHHLGGRSA